MLTIPASDWNGTKEELAAAVADFQAELEAHKLTEGVPAPWPPSDLIEMLARSGEEFEIEAPPPVVPNADAQLLAAMKALISERAKQPNPPGEVTAYLAAEKAVSEAVVANERAMQAGGKA